MAAPVTEFSKSSIETYVVSPPLLVLFLPFPIHFYIIFAHSTPSHLISSHLQKLIVHPTKQFTTYYPLLLNSTRALKLDGLDLDIEVPVPLNTTLHLLRSLNSDLGSNFTLSLAPVQQTLAGGPDPLAGGFSYKKLDSMATDPSKAGGKIIDFFNAQFYDGGTPGMGSAQEQIEAYGRIVDAGWDASRVCMALGTYNFDRESWRPIAAYQDQIRTLVGKFPGFGGVTGWDYWNAGLNDDAVKERWEWVRDIGMALYG